MSAMEFSSEASSHCKKINGTTVFYYFLRDAETKLRKGTSAICTLAETGQQSISDSRSANGAALIVSAKECAPMQCGKSAEITDGEM